MDKTSAAASVSPVKAPIYNSQTMMDRRHRILHEARVMISELGYENFSFRELARRADVAPRTLYNAFGSRENIVTSAILWYSKAFTDRVLYVEPAHTLRGQIERLIKVHSRNIQIRPYTSAIMAVYNTQNSTPSVRLAIRTLSNDSIRDFVDHLASNRYFEDHVTPKRFSEYVTSLVYCTLSDWCAGEILDDNLVGDLAETLLVATLAFTRGAARREAQEWLNHVRARTPEWERLRAASATTEPPQRAPRQAAKARKAPVTSRKSGERGSSTMVSLDGQSDKTLPPI
jgi:AcrR family transcriptional regulator